MHTQLNALCQIPRLYLAWNMVKAKGSVGGIDGISILEFEKDKRKEIPRLADELKSGTWKPQPYMEIEVAKTKNPEEMRKLGMTAIRDKIVQHAIKSVIEPRYEKIFLGNSYGYRPGKGATKAIRRVLAECFNSKYMQNTLWVKQSAADTMQRNTIALGIIEGKIKNQHALLKYFNKYHKTHYPRLKSKMEMIEKVAEDFKTWRKTAKPAENDFLQKLPGHEAQVAIRYWDYIRELFSDDNVKFEQREHQGAKDLVNSMLNYGYAILYVRVWQALLAAHLNPFDSLIHAHREGKPTLVYDRDIS